ncbi:hypothetical protein BpHYR1_019454 [Brachionus plicatilis]|uniref:Uncharacterized protein n=1 Tax=Brachionus plicatilis TaxID=10195 RepID=A0A3M7SF21_BRAPC|nr:hypothetical protein BpHYR1_019454 [Brachionus plicatilis]
MEEFFKKFSTFLCYLLNYHNFSKCDNILLLIIFNKTYYKNYINLYKKVTDLIEKRRNLTI